MVKLVKNHDEKKFLKELEKEIEKTPNANVQYGVVNGTMNRVLFTALLITR